MEKINSFNSADNNDIDNINNFNVSEYRINKGFQPSNLIDIDITPNVDITDLVIKKNQDEITNFESGYYVPNKKNHLTGYLNYHTLNDFNFNEQMYTYNAYGFAQDPTDFTKDQIVGNVDKFENPNQSRSVFTSSSRAQKDYKRKMKSTRKKYGDPGSGEFMGPWATYEGEEVFKNLSGKELTEEQKQILEQMEIKRQSKLEDLKQDDQKVLNVTIILIFSSNLHLNSI
jgi:hypothetical protein